MRLRACLIVAAFCVVSFAHADVFNFNAQGSAGGFSGSGTLTTDSNGDGSYTVIGITGPGVTGLIDPGQFQFNDNLLFPGEASLLDEEGFSFTDVMGDTSYDVNIFYDSDSAAYFTILEDADGNGQFLDTTFSVSAVTPEPSSVALLGTGFLGLAGVSRRRSDA